MKKIFAFVFSLMLAFTGVVSAEYNKYNEEPYINIYNMTIGEIAENMDIDFEEFKAFYGLPQDMPADTNETAAYYNITLENYIATDVISIDEALKMLEDIGISATKDTPYKDIENQITVKEWIGNGTIEDFRERYGFGEDITEDTLYSSVNTEVCKQELIKNGILKYFTTNSMLVMVNGKYLDFDVEPVVINNRILVPFRTIFEALNATVTWDPETNTVYATRGNTDISITIGSQELNKSFTDEQGVVSDISYTLDSPAIATNNRTLVPLRAVAESFDIQVGYVPETKTAVIH